MGLAWPSEFPGVVTQRFGPVDLDKEPRGFFESDGVGVLRALKSTFPNSERRDHVHLGLDVRAREGTKLFAAEAGEIVNADMFANGELFIQVRIQPGVVLHYGHCSSFVSNVGDQVARGQLIARAGHTGITTGTSANPASGAHLHIEVRITEVGTDGVSREMRYNPARFFAELGGDLVAGEGAVRGRRSELCGQLEGRLHLGQVGGARRTGGQVVLEAGPVARRQRVTEVLRDQLDDLLANELDVL